MLELIRPDWPVGPNVQAAFTTRRGGVSEGAYSALNLALHVGDQASRVLKNRSLLAEAVEQPESGFLWLEQVHGTRVVEGEGWQPGVEADACTTDVPGKVCVVMVADCLPVLFCNRAGTRVAAAHAGWRGLLNGVLERTLEAFPDKDEVLVCLGPAIGPDAFEVGPEVYEAFINESPDVRTLFRASSLKGGHYLADLHGLARERLLRRTRCQVFTVNLCTYRDEEQFFSYRREGVTGRQSGLIYLS